MIQFDAQTGRYIREYEAHRADRLTENADGLLFEKRTAITSEVKKWILQFGGGARVLSPQSLAEQIVEEAEQMIKNYGMYR